MIRSVTEEPGRAGIGRDDAPKGYDPTEAKAAEPSSQAPGPPIQGLLEGSRWLTSKNRLSLTARAETHDPNRPYKP
jgi:hypothetical protein